ncbi:MAG: hypothetical protein ACPL25_07825 [Ignavibacteria bacterium]
MRSNLVIVLTAFFLILYLQLGSNEIGSSSEYLTVFYNNLQFSPKIDTVDSLNPTLRWFRIRNAIKYQVIISEYEDSLNEKSKSIIRSFEVTDTFFIVPDLVLQDKKYYSWNVRAFDGKNWGRFGDEFYFKVDLMKSQIESKPVTVTPGKFSPEIEIIKTLNPVFKWFKIPNAETYELIIFEEGKPSEKRKIFSMENFGLLKDTFFVLKGNLLHSNVNYSWQVRAKTKIKFTPLSELRYFKISLPKKIVVPEPIYPGYKIENKEVVATTTPTFVWKKNTDAESYSIAISKKFDDNKYKLIYDSEKFFKLKDTVFSIPEGILENNSSYRWNIKVNLNDGRVGYSGRLYFKVNVFETQKFEIPQKTSSESENLEEIILTLEYDGIVKTFVQALAYNDEIYVSIEDLLGSLKIPFSMSDHKIIGSRTENKEDYFSIDLNKKKAKTQTVEFDYQENDLIDYYNKKYFSLRFIEKLLSIKLEFDFSNLVLYVKSEIELPVYNEFLLEQKLSSLKKVKKEKPVPLIFKRNRSLLNGFIFDYDLSQTMLRNNRSNYNLKFSIGGEIFYGDFYYSRQVFNAVNAKNIIENCNWKYNPDQNKILSQISLGDNFLDGINSYTYRGFKLTNEPVEPRKKIGIYTYKDITEPNSYVELYLNNQLIDITKSGEKGNFSFDFPINYGMSNFEFRIYTLKGETKTYRRIFQIPYDLIPEGTFNYQISYGKLKFTENQLANIEFKYGVKDYLTFNTGSEFIKEPNEKHLNFFGNSYFRLSPNLFFNIFYSPKIQTKITANYIRPDYASAYLEFVNYKANKFYNLSRLKNSFRGNLYFPIKMKKTELGIYFNYESNKSEISKRDMWSFNSFLFLRSVSLSSSLNFENNRYGSLVKRRDFVFGSTINFNNIFKNAPILNRSFLRSIATFDILKNKIFSYSVFYTTTLTQNLRFQISFEQIIPIQTSNFNLNLFLEFPQFRYLSSSNGKDLYNHQLSGSIGYSPEINQFYLYRESQVGRAALYIEGFEDKNGNGAKDKDEKNLSGLDFIINSAVYSTNLKNNAKLFYGLNPYQEYSIRLNESNLKSLNYSYENSEFRLITDGNKLKVIQLPYYETGEIGGSVIRQFENEEIPVVNVPLIIRNKDSKKEYSIFTFSDGSFYFYGLTKGKYEIEIDQNFLEHLSLKSYPEKFEFEINPQFDQLIIENLRFVIKQ